MTKKQSSHSDLSDEVLSSEPLNTFLGNVESISSLLSMTSSTISKRENELKQSLDETAERRKYHEAKLKEDKDRLKEINRMRSQIEAEGLEQLFGQAQTLFTERKAFIKDLKSDIEKNYPSLLDTYQRQKTVLMPMVFVYLVTIWDAFVMDTVRKILGVSPYLISTSDAKIEVKRSFLWSAESGEDIRNYLIEDKVRQLDYDRKELLRCFKEHWGIDWEESGISLDDVVEIRARRDIWVHNKGIVNKQYLDMLGEGTSLKERQAAQIDIQYFGDCLKKLTALAVYIHKIAYKKHYAKTDIG